MACVLDNLRVVLAGPLYGGNVGSVCRAMGNMGLSDLVIADPRPLDEQEVARLACAAYPIFQARREVASLEEAVADCHRIAGTSAREGLYRNHGTSPRHAAPLLIKAAGGGKTALVFGREDNGLSNQELALCTDIIRIPTGERIASLNLAQAVMVCLYELFLAAGEYQGPVENSPAAPSELRERMLDIWEQALLQIGFMKTDKAMHMMLGLRRILSRGQLTVNDVKILMGIGRQTLWMASRHQSMPSGGPPGKVAPFPEDQGHKE